MTLFSFTSGALTILSPVKLLLKPRPNTPPTVDRILAIDPGTYNSAFIRYSIVGRSWTTFGKVANERLLAEIYLKRPDAVVCEDMQAMGMRVGRETFRTCRYIGRIEQICRSEDIPFFTVYRREEKKLLCAGIVRPKDKHVRAALIDLYGDQGTSKAPGPTYGISADVWSALSVAHTFAHRHRRQTNGR